MENIEDINKKRKRKGRNKGLANVKSRAKNSCKKAKSVIKIPLPDPEGEDVQMQAPETPLFTFNLETSFADVKMVEAHPDAMYGEDLFEEEEDDAIMEEDAQV